MALLHHVQGCHVWTTGHCEHDDLTHVPMDTDGNVVENLHEGEPALERLRDVVRDRQWIQSMHYYSRSMYIAGNVLYNNASLI